MNIYVNIFMKEKPKQKLFKNRTKIYQSLFIKLKIEMNWKWLDRDIDKVKLFCLLSLSSVFVLNICICIGERIYIFYNNRMFCNRNLKNYISI